MFTQRSTAQHSITQPSTALCLLGYLGLGLLGWVRIRDPESTPSPWQREGWSGPCLRMTEGGLDPWGRGGGVRGGLLREGSCGLPAILRDTVPGLLCGSWKEAEARMSELEGRPGGASTYPMRWLPCLQGTARHGTLQRAQQGKRACETTSPSGGTPPEEENGREACPSVCCLSAGQGPNMPHSPTGQGVLGAQRGVPHSRWGGTACAAW